MEERNLEFLDTLTVEQFKAAQHVAEVKVLKNTKTGKLFFSYGAKTGAVSLKGVPTHPMISKVRGRDNEEFWLLHEEGTGSAEVVAIF